MLCEASHETVTLGGGSTHHVDEGTAWPFPAVRAEPRRVKSSP